MITPIGIWLMAGTPVNKPYPCRCWIGRRCNTTGAHRAYWCPCWRRHDDLDRMPAACCGRRVALDEEAPKP